MQTTSAASVLLGRGAGAGAGNVQELTLGSGLSLSGTTLSATGSGTVSGTTNYVAKFTGASAVGNSQIFDNGTNVGIGTVSPAQKLTLSDGTSTVFLLEKTGGSAKNWYITNSAASAQTFGVSDETTYRLVINNVGNVGIGTTSPDRSLVVKAMGGLGGAISVWPTTDSTEASIRFATTAAGGGNTWYAGQGVWGSGAGNFAIGDVANRLTILSSGNVGIGTTNPGRPLEVDGGDRQLRLRNFATAPGKYWDIGPDGGNNFTLYNQGNAGAYISDGGTTWNAVSDARLKTDVRPLENNSSLEAMLKLRPVTFHWKSVASSKALQTGFIAQEVQRVLPNLVSAAPDADIASTNGNVTKIRSVLGINYTGLVVPIVKAVQELKTLHDSDIAKLEAANDNQAAEIEALRADIEALRKADH
jgi:hypothetical protein